MVFQTEFLIELIEGLWIYFVSAKFGNHTAVIDKQIEWVFTALNFEYILLLIEFNISVVQKKNILLSNYSETFLAEELYSITIVNLLFQILV